MTLKLQRVQHERVLRSSTWGDRGAGSTPGMLVVSRTRVAIMLNIHNNKGLLERRRVPRHVIHSLRNPRSFSRCVSSLSTRPRSSRLLVESCALFLFFKTILQGCVLFFYSLHRYAPRNIAHFICKSQLEGSVDYESRVHVYAHVRILCALVYFSTEQQESILPTHQRHPKHCETSLSLSLVDSSFCEMNTFQRHEQIR